MCNLIHVLVVASFNTLWNGVKPSYVDIIPYKFIYGYNACLYRSIWAKNKDKVS